MVVREIKQQRYLSFGQRTSVNIQLLMAMYQCVFFIILGVFSLTSYACVTLEEGRNGYLNCGDSYVRKNISFELEVDGQLVNVSTCRTDGTCENFMPDMFKSRFVRSIYRKSNRLDILRVSKNYTKFQCKKDGKLLASCTVDVFVSPAKPTCSPPVVNTARSEVSLTCRTESVYPDVECTFYHRDYMSPRQLRGIYSIRYSLTPSKVSPGNMAAECTIVLSKRSLQQQRTSYEFKVAMKAKPKDNRKKAYSVESDYTCPFYPDPTNAPQAASLLCKNTKKVDSPKTFVNPSKPYCDRPRLVQNSTKIAVTCRTEQVYPRARCEFYVRKSETQEPVWTHIVDVSYLEFPSRVSPGDKETECTAFFPSRLAMFEPVVFMVVMNPDVTGANRVNRASDFTQSFAIGQPVNQVSSYLNFVLDIFSFFGLNGSS